MKLLRLGLVALFLIAMSAGAAWAWGNASNCVSCHTTLTAGGALHTAHNTFITECGYCHGDSGVTPVLTNESALDPDNSCTGCHTLGGLYAKHGGADACSPCHSGNPPAPGLESDVPPYYGTVATSITNPCDDNLDNDGDGLVDTDDSDCPEVDVEWKSWSLIKETYGE